MLHAPLQPHSSSYCPLFPGYFQGSPLNPFILWLPLCPSAKCVAAQGLCFLFLCDRRVIQMCMQVHETRHALSSWCNMSPLLDRNPICRGDEDRHYWEKIAEDKRRRAAGSTLLIDDNNCENVFEIRPWITRLLETAQQWSFPFCITHLRINPEL